MSLQKLHTLTYLSFKINKLSSFIVDGNRLENGLLLYMKNLKKFDFHIISIGTNFESSHIMSTFKTTYWCQEHNWHVGCYSNSEYKYFHLFSLPFAYSNLDQIGLNFFYGTMNVENIWFDEDGKKCVEDAHYTNINGWKNVRELQLVSNDCSTTQSIFITELIDIFQIEEFYNLKKITFNSFEFSDPDEINYSYFKFIKPETLILNDCSIKNYNTMKALLLLMHGHFREMKFDYNQLSSLIFNKHSQFEFDPNGYSKTTPFEYCSFEGNDEDDFFKSCRIGDNEDKNFDICQELYDIFNRVIILELCASRIENELDTFSTILRYLFVNVEDFTLNLCDEVYSLCQIVECIVSCMHKLSHLHIYNFWTWDSDYSVKEFISEKFNPNLFDIKYQAEDIPRHPRYRMGILEIKNRYSYTRC
ncbi:unnamed protein product [Didymodactylos carnosus]|uniref:Uncharacterized protein n=1 Tax=Didymodactylos carnosus TaxID=1234261 RepID=A0A814KS61_9BILA|nr:unnamed protein product [Didymodactylos carnosus]CAF3825175.1 unnamed protein product [Didymodactylos carnosus]